MLDRLKTYQDNYSSLSKEEKKGYVKSLDEDTDVRAEVKALAWHFLGLEMTNCGWCYIEAHTRLIKLNTDNMSTKTLEYQLATGTLLHDPINKNIDLRLTPQTLLLKGEELALYHIAFNKNALKYFTKTPADLQERLENFLKNQDSDLAKSAGDARNARIGILEIQLKQTTEVYTQATKAFKEAEASFKKAKAALEEAKNLNAEAAPKPKAETKKKEAGADKNKGKDTPKGSETPAPEDEDEDEGAKAVKEEIAEFIAAGMSDEEIFEALGSVNETDPIRETVIAVRAAGEPLD